MSMYPARGCTSGGVNLEEPRTERKRRVVAVAKTLFATAVSVSSAGGDCQMRKRRYSELRHLQTFEERFEYLRLVGQVGEATFGFDRWVNQQFYTSQQWKRVRDRVILRDMGCDLGVPGYEVHHGLLVHHMNPMTVEDIERGHSWILNPEFLICTSKRTHNAIHYGGELPRPRPVERRPGDTKLW